MRARRWPTLDAWWAPGAILWALAWVHRVLFILSNQDRSWGFSVFYEGDAEPFYLFARAILSGATYDSGIPFHPPGFPALLALVHGLVGAGAPGAAVPHLAVKILLAGISAAAIPLLYELVRPFAGAATALLASAACTYGFGLYVLAASPVSEGPFQVLLLAILVAFTRAMSHGLAAPGAGPRREALAGLGVGVMAGMACLTRAESQLAAAALLSVGALGTLRRPWRARALVPWLLACAGLLAVIAPWTWRNHLALTEHNARNAARYPEALPTFVPITAYGPLNLALANNERADGGFSRAALTSQATAGRLDLTDPQHWHFFRHGDDLAWAFAREDPRRFARLVLRKWSLFFGALRLGFLQWDVPGGLDGVRRPVDMFVPTGGGAFAATTGALVLAGAALAVARPGGPRRLALLVALLTLCWMASTALFFGYARLGMILQPLWLAMAAYGVTEALGKLPLAARVGRTSTRSKAGALAAVAAALLCLEALGAINGRTLHASGTSFAGQRHINPHETVYLGTAPPEP